MRDGLGNKIEEGSLLFWMSMKLSCRVRKVDDSGLTLVGKDGPQQAPPSITLEITLPIKTDGMPRGAEPQLADFLRVVDPAAQNFLERALNGTKQ